MGKRVIKHSSRHRFVAEWLSGNQMDSSERIDAVGVVVCPALIGVMIWLVGQMLG